MLLLSGVLLSLLAIECVQYYCMTPSQGYVSIMCCASGVGTCTARAVTVLHVGNIIIHML